MRSGLPDVRRATEADRLAVVRLLKASHAAAGFTFPFSAPHADRLFREHMASGLVLVLGEPAQGVLMARTFEHPFGAGLWAKETVWFIAPEARGRAALQMLDAYEAWAREQGCTTIGMASLASNDVSRIYERRGYAPAETHFVKTLA
jgi:GNAT superfamily N-acetyltransferase